MVEYNDKKIHFGSAKTEDYVTHHDQVRREKYLKKLKELLIKMVVYLMNYHFIQIIGLSIF